MENPEQQFPLLESEEGQEQAEYYDWRYELDENEGNESAGASSFPVLPSQQLEVSQLPFPDEQPPQIASQASTKLIYSYWDGKNEYPELPDMGSSLGYGQGLEYQYFDAPQPSQPIPQLRRDRLRQLRQKRMRRLKRAKNPLFSLALGQIWQVPAARLKRWLDRVSKRLKYAQELLRMPDAVPGKERSPWSPDPPTEPFKSAIPVTAPLGTLEVPLHTTTSSISVEARQGAGRSGMTGGLTSPRLSTSLEPISGELSVDACSAEMKSRNTLKSPLAYSGSRLLPIEPEGSHSVVGGPLDDTGLVESVRIKRAAFILTGAFVASRVLGLLRTSLFAFVFGTSSTSDAYLQAFLVPDLIFNIVAGGALSSAFIPVFAHYMSSEKDEKTAWHVASSALNLAIFVMSALALIAIVFARQLVPLYNPGLRADQLDLIASLTRIMLLQSIALGVGVIVTSVLNARQNFRAPAIGTVLYNCGLIIGLFPGAFFALRGLPNDQVAVYCATWGVVLGAVFQVGIQIPALLYVGMRYTRVADWRHPGVRQIGRQMIPRVINAAMLYVSIFVDRSLILLLVVAGVADMNGLITQYYQALQLMLLPLGIFGMSISTAAFPTLAENVVLRRFDRVRSTILTTLRSILFLSIPSSVGLIVLSFPIIQVLLQHGHYTLQDAESTSIPLIFFAVGLTGLASVEILTRSFYAMRDSVTPVTVSIAQFIVKIVLSLILIRFAFWGSMWGLGALALSTSIAGLLEAGVMLWLLQKRVGPLLLRRLAHFVMRVLVAALVMGICLLLVRGLLDLIFVTTQPRLQLGGELLAVLKLAIELSVGVFVYIRVARYLNIEELGPVKRLLDRLKLSWI